MMIVMAGWLSVNNHVYTASESDGLMEIKGDSIVPLPDGKKIGRGFRFIIPYNDTAGSKKILIGTEADSFTYMMAKHAHS